MIPPRLLVSHKHVAPRELVQLREYAESEARFWCVRELAKLAHVCEIRGGWSVLYRVP